MTHFAYYIGGPLDLTKKCFGDSFPPFEERVVHRSFEPIAISEVPEKLAKLKVHRYERTQFKSQEIGDVFFYIYSGLL